jgi:hypothetical protein
MSLGAGIVIQERTFKASLKGEAFTLPAKLFVAIAEGEPTHATTGTELEGLEVQYTTYARAEVPLAEWEFTPGTGTVKAKAVNKAAVKFATPSAVGARKVAKFFAICDAVTAGNQFYTGKLETEQTINVGGTVEVAAKALEVTWE